MKPQVTALLCTVIASVSIITAAWLLRQPQYEFHVLTHKDGAREVSYLVEVDRLDPVATRPLHHNRHTITVINSGALERYRAETESYLTKGPTP